MHVDLEADAVAAVAEAAPLISDADKAAAAAVAMASSLESKAIGKHALLQHNLEAGKAKQKAKMQERIARKRRMVETLTARFHELDHDGDGSVAWDELAPLLAASMGNAPREEKDATLKELVREYDKDGNGTLSMAEGLKLLHNIEKASMLADCVAHVHGVIARFDAQSDTDDAIDAAPFAREELEIMLDCAHSVEARALLSTYATEDGAELTADHAREVVHTLHRERAVLLAQEPAAAAPPVEVPGGGNSGATAVAAAAAARPSAIDRRRVLSPVGRQMKHLAVIVQVAHRIDAARASGPEGSVLFDEMSTLLATTLPETLFEGCTVEERDALLHDLIAEHDVNEDGVVYIDELEAKLAHMRDAATHETHCVSVQLIASAAAASAVSNGTPEGDGALSLDEARSALEKDPRHLEQGEIDALISQIAGENGTVQKDELDAIARQIALRQASAVAAADAYTNASAVLAAAENSMASTQQSKLQARLATRQRRKTLALARASASVSSPGASDATVGGPALTAVSESETASAASAVEIAVAAVVEAHAAADDADEAFVTDLLTGQLAAAEKVAAAAVALTDEGSAATNAGEQKKATAKAKALRKRLAARKRRKTELSALKAAAASACVPVSASISASAGTGPKSKPNSRGGGKSSSNASRGASSTTVLATVSAAGVSEVAAQIKAHAAADDADEAFVMRLLNEQLAAADKAAAAAVASADGSAAVEVVADRKEAAANSNALRHRLAARKRRKTEVNTLKAAAASAPTSDSQPAARRIRGEASSEVREASSAADGGSAAVDVIRADLDTATEKVASLGTALAYSEERLRLAQSAQTAGAEELAALQSTANAAAVAVQAELRAEKERAQREVASFQEELKQQREARARTEAAALRDRNTAQARIAALEGTIEAARSVTSDASEAGEAHEAATLRAAASKHAAAVAAVMEQLRASEVGCSASEQSVSDVKRQLTAAQAERDALVAREASAKAALEQLKAANVALQHDTACARAEVSAAATAGHSHEEAHVRELAQKHDEVLETLRRQLCTSEEDRDIARAAASSASSDLKHLREVNVELEASIAGLHSDAVAAAAGGEAADVAHAAALTAQHDAQMARAATKLRSSESHIKSLEAEAEVSSAKVRQLERATTRLESELTAAAEHASLAASDGQRHEDQHVRALARNHAAEVAKMQARLDDARARIVHPATSPSFSTPSASPSRSTPSRLTKGSPRAAAAHKFEEQLRLVEDRLRTVSESIGEYVARCSKADAA